MVLICVALMLSDVAPLFMCLLASGKHLLLPFLHLAPGFVILGWAHLSNSASHYKYMWAGRALLHVSRPPWASEVVKACCKHFCGRDRRKRTRNIGDLLCFERDTLSFLPIYFCQDKSYGQAQSQGTGRYTLATRVMAKFVDVVR